MKCVPDENGKCTVCGWQSKKYKKYKRECAIRGPGDVSVPREIVSEIQPKATKRGMLLGDAIAALTKAVGIPPCGGCEQRRKWLNKAHEWIAGYFS